MRYVMFLPENKGGYKVGEEDELVAALCLRHELNQKYQTVCVLYDSKLKTTDVKVMIDDDVKEECEFI